MRTKALNGHSGCKVLLCENDARVFVRKISSSREYNTRLQTQVNKQAHFESRFVNAPRILNSGITDDGLYYFDMEYVRGVTLAEYMHRIEIGKIRGIVSGLMSHISEVNRKSGPDRTDVFLSKINALRQSLSLWMTVIPGADMQVINRTLAVLEAHSWKNFTQSSCHGDLTLENIIVRDGELYFIDFLDSFYDCWLLDISTLLQDVYTMWAYRDWNAIDINTQIRLAVFRDILVDEICGIDGGMWIIEAFYALLLKLLRIYPYTRDEKTIRFLNAKLTEVLLLLEKGDFMPCER